MICYRERRCPSLIDSVASAISLVVPVFFLVLFIMLFVLFGLRLREHRLREGAGDSKMSPTDAVQKFISRVFPTPHDLQERCDDLQERVERAEDRADRAEASLADRVDRGEASLAVVSAALLRAGLLAEKEAAELEQYHSGSLADAEVAEPKNAPPPRGGGSASAEALRSVPQQEDESHPTTYGALATSSSTTRFRANSSARSRGTTRDLLEEEAEEH